MVHVHADSDEPSRTACSRCVARWEATDARKAVVWCGLVLMRSWPVVRRHWGQTAGVGGRRLAVLQTRRCSCSPIDCVGGLWRVCWVCCYWQRPLNGSYLFQWTVAQQQDILMWVFIVYVRAKVSRWLDSLYLVGPSWTFSLGTYWQRRGRAHQRNSVLSPFSCSLLLRIHPRTSPNSPTF